MSDTLSKLRDQEEDFINGKGLKLLDQARYYRNGAKVKRYHTVDCHVLETVGHHSANVAILCGIISCQRASVHLLMAALTHDMTEQFTGDVPATAKWGSPELADALKKLDTAYARDCFSSQLDAYEKKVLKQADMLDLCLKALEELQMGNQQFRFILQRGLNYLRSNNPFPTTELIMKEIQREVSK